MAVIPGIPGLSVGIAVEGQLLPKYDPDPDLSRESPPEEDNTITRCIEAQANTQWEIWVKVDGEYEHTEYNLLVKPMVDGHVLKGRCFMARCMPGTFKFDKTTDAEGERTFMFSDLVLTEDPRNPDINNFGSIIISLARRENGGFAGYGPDAKQKKALRLPEDISEKDCKGTVQSLRCRFSEPDMISSKPERKTPFTTGRWIDRVGSPFCVFTFLYGSRSDLQISGVIPRSRSPTPLDQKDPATLTQEESQELRRQQQKREEIRQKRKREVEEHEKDMFVTSDTETEDGDDDDDEDDEEVEVVFIGKRRRLHAPGPNDEVIVLD